MSLCNYPFRIFYSPADEPLHNFYIPALSACIQYDRTAGFFSSTALAVAAAGVARLIHHRGRMRLLVGAALDEADVEAIQQGHDLKSRLTERLLERFPDPQDALLRQRLEVLAWMVAEGMLEIRVVLPRDEQGLPIPAYQAQDYFHPKTGVFTDRQGYQVAFSGSVNESETAWTKNYESFAVYFSWNETKPYLAQVVHNFEQLWSGQESDWIALDVPEAVKNRLLQFKPSQAPERDPLEKEPVAVEPVELPIDYQKAEPHDRLLFQFLRDAPHLLNASGLGAATAAIVPWPHQARVAEAVIRDFPSRAMFSDEVGLGKTIEAGMVIRQLLLSGRVRRVLFLVPKSVLKQWQEELYEKFNLNLPRFDGSRFWDVDDQPLLISNPNSNPWEAFPVFLAGSQLAKRADRRQQILQAQSWDLVVVDEAHHARRKDFKERIYRPNRLLSLLNELDEEGKVGSLLLITATPMQVHPLEVWDLLRLLGMGGKWGADEDNFLNFFAELRKSFDAVDWEFTFDLVHDYLETGGLVDSHLESQAQADLGVVKWAQLKSLSAKRGGISQAIKQLGSQAQPYVEAMARRHTPLRRFIFRNTRSLLREYMNRGILTENVPEREPKIVRVPMTAEEFSLYERIEEYITHFYQKYEQERRGLGFIMTVYRRRLTSSFYAIRCSLERRLKYLLGEITQEKTVVDDDIEQEELSLDVSEEFEDEPDRKRYAAEVVYVRNFIQELRTLSVADSKLEWLKSELNQLFKERSKVLVFTQYTDTMDYLREQLLEVYGTQVACYSGRGGEVWNGIAWALTTKEDVKNEFKEGEIRILLCTDSASEGLNLQTCGVLINYDMPWNPMRVEQRIGRIDRIGQEYATVWISSYFYQDTIEDLIYQRLSDRIEWFEAVVGKLQPILAEVGEATRKLAMMPSDQRKAQLEKELNALELRLQDRELESLNLDEFILAEDPQNAQSSPVNLPEIEQLLTQSSLTGRLFKPHPEISGAYQLAWQEEILQVTFSPACFDEHPDTVRFLSYGSQLLEEILDSIPAPEPAESCGLIRLFANENGLDLRVWYKPSEDGTEPKPVESLAQLQACLERWDQEGSTILDGALEVRAEKTFLEDVKRIQTRQEQILQQRRKALVLAEKARGQRLLVKAALIELALGQQGTLWEKESYPSAFDEAAIKGLKRHGYPWTALLRLAYEDGLKVESDDPYFQQIQESSRDSLKGRFNQLVDEARRLVQSLSAVQAGRTRVTN